MGSLLDGLKARAMAVVKAARGGLPLLPNENAARNAPTSELGYRPTPENQLKYAYRQLWVDPDLRQTIIDIREMDKLDGRVKRIHSKMAGHIVKGGLVMMQGSPSKALAKEWEAFSRRLQLYRIEKLKSDARGLVMEGNLPMQWVLDREFNVDSGLRMPSETILPNVGMDGRFKDVLEAYYQMDIMTGSTLATFPLWQLSLARLDPDNFDDLGSLGRPFLDANRKTWRKLDMTEEDLVIRRRMRAPLRMAHILKNATLDEVKAYELKLESNQAHGVMTDYVTNKEGGVSALQGDSNLDQMGDIVHLMETFYAGGPAPKGLMGYTEGMARDILEDLKRDYFDEIDLAQDLQSGIYEEGFRMHLLLKNINPDNEDYSITFAERRTETMTQSVDIGLKMQALGYPKSMIFERLGDDPAYVEQRRKADAQQYEPYPDPDAQTTPTAVLPPTAQRRAAKVSITPGNGRKGESGTSISNG